jgi:hypothetical protein
VLNTLQSIATAIAIIAGSVAFLLALRRIWPTEQRRQHNDLIGWQVTVVGTTYAVILGFMLYTVWTNFEIAEGNAEAEANSLVSLARSAKGLPSAPGQKIQDLARAYVDIMLTDEWPAMNRGAFSPESHRKIQQLWTVATKAEVHTASEQTSLDHVLSELYEMTNHRRLRQLEAIASLPGILWAVLIIGAVVTIVSACLFGSVEFKLHLIQVVMLAMLLSLVLVAIADINRPFQGSVHVSPAGFERARQALADLAREH